MNKTERFYEQYEKTFTQLYQTNVPGIQQMYSQMFGEKAASALQNESLRHYGEVTGLRHAADIFGISFDKLDEIEQKVANSFK